LGDRDQPKPKQKQKKQKNLDVKQVVTSNMDDDTEEQYDDDMSLHEAILMTHQLREAESTDKKSTTSGNGSSTATKRRVIKPDSYFSDEDADSN